MILNDGFIRLEVLFSRKIHISTYQTATWLVMNKFPLMWGLFINHIAFLQCTHFVWTMAIDHVIYGRPLTWWTEGRKTIEREPVFNVPGASSQIWKRTRPTTMRHNKEFSFQYLKQCLKKIFLEILEKFIRQFLVDFQKK